MPYTLKQKVVKIILWFLDKIVGNQKPVSMNIETQQKMLARFYESQPVRDWLAERERYLIDQAIERFIAGKLEGARGLAGQLLEIRAFKARLMAAWFHTKKQSEKALTSVNRT